MSEKTTDVKAIETMYNGYRFRSRLEARWAVFFDAMGIKYEYEKEGFNLPSGKYLPDFWLPDWEIWFEVKGKFPTTDELIKLQDLCIHTGYAACVSEGIPSMEFQGQCFVYGNEVAYHKGKHEFVPLEYTKIHLCSFFISNYPDGNHEAWFILDEWEDHHFYKKLSDGSFQRYPERPFIQVQGDEEYIKWAIPGCENCNNGFSHLAPAIIEAKSLLSG